MTGQEIQDKLDAIVLDLQTKDKGKTVQMSYRAGDGSLVVMPLSSNSSGEINDAQLDAIQDLVDGWKAAADAYETVKAPVTAAGETYRTAREAHQTLIDAAKASRDALAAALENDAAYQTAKTAYDAARLDSAYIAARTAYSDGFIGENVGNLSESRGKYANIVTT